MILSWTTWAILLVLAGLAFLVLYEARKNDIEAEIERKRREDLLDSLGGNFYPSPEALDDARIAEIVRASQPMPLEPRPPCETVPEIQRTERIRAGVRS